jgi:hypothetical protein
MRRVPELWAVHLPSGQTWQVEFPEGEQFQLAAQQGDALYCYARAEAAQRHLYRLEGGAIQSRVAVPPISRFIAVPDWGKGISFLSDLSGSARRWWLSDGTAGGTTLLAEGLQQHTPFAQLGEQQLFVAPDNRLYVSDGTYAGTKPIVQFDRDATEFRRLGSLLLFNLGGQTWRTDGTVEGTYALLSQRATALASVVGNTAVLVTRRANLNSGNSQVWSTDGTVAGTRMLMELNEAFPQAFALGGHHYFMGKEAFSGLFHCWRYDAMLGGVPTFLPSSALHHLKVATRAVPVEGEWVLLEGDTEDNLRVVLAFDGLEAFPVEHWTGPAHLSFGNEDELDYRLAWPHLRALGEQIYTPMQHSHLGVELWRIGRDGSTALMADIAPGVRWSHPRPLAAWGGQVYFLGKTPGLGAGLFRSPAEAAVDLPPLAASGYHWAQALTPSRSRYSAGLTSYVLTGDIVVSSAGDLYLGGERNGLAGLAFPGQDVVLPASKNWHPNTHYLVKLDGRSGRVKWARNLAYDLGKFYTHDVRLAPAPDDGVYAAQVFWAEALFSDTVSTNSALTYLARFDSSGQPLWHLTADLGPQGGPLGLQAGRDGSVYLAGHFYFYRGRLGNQALNSTNSPAMFLARISPEGAVQQVANIDLPPYWRSFSGLVSMKQSPDGSFYLTLSRNGPNTFQTCGFRPSEILLYCISEDLQDIRWQRTLTVSDLAYAPTLSVSADGLVYLGGRYRGDFEIDGQAISVPCTAPSSFMAVFSPWGRLLKLTDLEQGAFIPYDLQFEPDGTYLLAGIERHEERERYYAGYEDVPFPSGEMTAAVQRRCPYSQELLSERRFLKPRWSSSDAHLHKPNLAVLPGGQIVLQDRLGEYSILDTLANVPFMYRSNQAVVLSFDLPTEGRQCAELAGPRLELPLEFALGPNPTRDYAWLFPPLEIDAGLLRLSLRNMAGQPVPLREASGDRSHRQIDLSSLPAGVYVLSVQYGSQQENLKIVKL